MSRELAASPLRCLAVGLAVTIGAIAVIDALAPDLAAAVRLVAAGDLDRVPFDRLLALVATIALAACTGWGWLVTMLVVVGALRGHEIRRGCPAPLRQLILATCGSVLAGAALAPAHASAGTPPGWEGGAAVHGLPLPDRTESDGAASDGAASDGAASDGAASGRGDPSRSGPTSAAAARGGVEAAHVVTVRPGDSLWRIARHELGPDASAASVAARWPRIFAANRDVLGPDPDLIHPGTSLRLPGAGEEHP